MLLFAIRNLASRPTRSVLALLGLTVAIMGMVGLFSVAVGLNRTVSRTFDRLPGLVAMQPGAPIPLFSRVPATWADEIKAVPGVKIVRTEVWTRAHMVNGKVTFNPPRFIFGTDIPSTNQLEKAIYRDDIKRGRFLNDSDIGTNHCVISESIADDTGKGVGDTLRVDATTLEIVGVYSTGSILLDVAIIYDQSSVRSNYQIEKDLVSSVYIEPDGTCEPKVLTKRIQEVFRGRSLGSWRGSQPGALDPSALGNLGSLTQYVGNIGQLLSGGKSSASTTASPDAAADASTAMKTDAAVGNATTGQPKADAAAAEDGLEVRSAVDWGNRIQEFSADLDVFLYLMNGIGVAIALLSILNTMLMSVSERMTEFGVLKANGWSSLDLFKLIGWESALLGLWGGVLGCFLGWCGTHVVNWYIPQKLNLYASPGLLLFSLLFSMSLGLIGGAYPAWWATRMTPMDAIRRC